MKSAILHKYFSDDELLRISNKINSVEKNTSGEIAVSIKQYKPIISFKKTIKSLAEREYQRLEMYKTRERTGVLIFLLLSERQFYILADDNINKLTGEKIWADIKDLMQDKFVRGEFCKGILFGIDEIGKILSQHFPIRPDDINEISNRVVIKP
jgi:uncharacterized membrane protein